MRYLIYVIPLLPFLTYFIYASYKHRKMKKDEILIGIKNGPWVRLAFISLFTLIAVVVFMTLTNLEPKGEKYTPAQFIDGKLIPSKIE